MVDRHGASPQGEGAAPPEGGNGGGGSSPVSLSDGEEDSGTEPVTSDDEESPNRGVGAGDDPEGGYSEAGDSEEWSGCEGDDHCGYDSENERPDGETTDADANTYAGDWVRLGFRLVEGDGSSEEDGPATKEQVFSLPCVSRRINNGDLTQKTAGALWSKHAENGCGEQEFADFWNAVNKLPDHGLDDTDSEYDTDDGDGPITERHGASPQVEDAVPPEGGNGEGGGGPLRVPRDDGPDAGGDSEEDKSLEEDDEADDEVDLLKSEIADLRAVLRNKNAQIEYEHQRMDKSQEEKNSMRGDNADLELKIRPALGRRRCVRMANAAEVGSSLFSGAHRAAIYSKSICSALYSGHGVEMQAVTKPTTR